MGISFELEEMRALKEMCDHVTDSPGDVGQIYYEVTAKVRDSLEFFERIAPKTGDDREPA